MVSLFGRHPHHLGIHNGRLAPIMENRRNAVSSFSTSPRHHVDPLPAGDDPLVALARLEDIVTTMSCSRIVSARRGYVHARFRSRWLRLVDDIEFLADEAAGVIHVRSAARARHFDFGSNRRRVEQIRARLASMAAGRATAAPTSTTNRRDSMNYKTLPSGLQYEDTVVGDGPEAQSGARVSVHYTGWIYENGERGRKFDSSKDRGQPFVFPLGAGHVIRGWDEGVQGMKVGGTRMLVIPAELGYGARGAGGVIPPNATLQFEVELLSL